MRLRSSPSAGKVKGMRQMINALTASIVPVLNAMLIVLLFHCIFAVLGVKLFGTGGIVEDTLEEEEEEEEEEKLKAFDTFLSGMLTLFQSATLDNWSEMAQRANKSSMLFFVVFIIIITYVSAVEVTVE